MKARGLEIGKWAARAGESVDSWRPVWWFVGLLGALGAAQLLSSWHLTILPCGLRRLTGWPCPLCGGTRALQAAARQDWGGALSLNPLVFLAGVGIVCWLLLWLSDRLMRARLEARILGWGRRLPLGRLAVLAGILNWIYLCLAWAP